MTQSSEWTICGPMLAESRPIPVWIAIPRYAPDQRRTVPHGEGFGFVIRGSGVQLPLPAPSRKCLTLLVGRHLVSGIAMRGRRLQSARSSSRFNPHAAAGATHMLCSRRATVKFRADQKSIRQMFQAWGPQRTDVRRIVPSLLPQPRGLPPQVSVK